MNITFAEYINAQRVIWTLAKRGGMSPLKVRYLLRLDIDMAWEDAWRPGNLQAQVNWQLVFPDNVKPNAIQFIVGLARYSSSGKEPPVLLQQ